MRFHKNKWNNKKETNLIGKSTSLFLPKLSYNLIAFSDLIIINWSIKSI